MIASLCKICELQPISRLSRLSELMAFIVNEPIFSGGGFEGWPNKKQPFKLRKNHRQFGAWEWTTIDILIQQWIHRNRILILFCGDIKVKCETLKLVNLKVWNGESWYSSSFAVYFGEILSFLGIFVMSDGLGNSLWCAWELHVLPTTH